MHVQVQVHGTLGFCGAQIFSLSTRNTPVDSEVNFMKVFKHVKCNVQDARSKCITNI